MPTLAWACGHLRLRPTPSLSIRRRRCRFSTARARIAGWPAPLHQNPIHLGADEPARLMLGDMEGKEVVVSRVSVADVCNDRQADFLGLQLLCCSRATHAAGVLLAGVLRDLGGFLRRTAGEK